MTDLHAHEYFSNVVYYLRSIVPNKFSMPKKEVIVISNTEKFLIPKMNILQI